MGKMVWVNVDLIGEGQPIVSGYIVRSFSECRSGGVVYIRAVVSDGRRDEEIFGQGRDRTEALQTGLRRYRLIG